MTGSWAGAMGHTQFIPTSYLAYAVDFTGDGRRDIWSDDPTDALASTASLPCSRSGWRQGEPWGDEITASTPGLPAARLHPAAAGRAASSASFRNFDVIKRYNNSDSYALGVGHLSDRIAGGGPLRGGFPPDANGLTIEDRQRAAAPADGRGLRHRRHRRRDRLQQPTRAIRPTSAATACR